MKRITAFCCALSYAFALCSQDALPSLIEQGRTYAGTNDISGALNHAEQLIRQYPSDFNGYALKGIGYLYENRLEEGEKWLRQAISRKNKDPYRGAIDLLGAYGDLLPNEGKPAFYAILKDCVENWNPGGWEGWLALGNLYCSDGREEEAANAFEKAQTLAPSEPAHQNADISYALCLVQQGLTDRALALAERHTPGRVKDKRCLADMAQVYEMAGQMERTAACIEQLLLTDGTNHEWYHALAHAYQTAGDQAATCDAYRRWMSATGADPSEGVPDYCAQSDVRAALRPNNILIYEAAWGDKTCVLRVTLGEYEAGNQITFTWNCDPPVAPGGRVQMNASALDNAAVLTALFHESSPLSIEKTAFWVSRRLWTAMSRKAPVQIQVGDNPAESFAPEKKAEPARFWLGKRYLSLPALRYAAPSGKSLCVADAGGQGLIVYLAGEDFHISLREIR